MRVENANINDTIHELLNEYIWKTHRFPLQ
jgi:hypothetical protein